MENFRKEFTSTMELSPNQYYSHTQVIKEKWVFDDNGIIFEKRYDEETIKKHGNGEVIKCFYPYGNLKKIKFSRSGIEIIFFDNHSIDKFSTWSFMSSRENDLKDMKIAAKFAKKQQKVQGVDFSKTRILETVTGNKYDKGIFIMQCEICGQVFQYTDDDMKEHAKTSVEADLIQNQAAILGGIGAIGIASQNGALSTAGISSQITSLRAENMRNSLVDYNSCPKCHSKNLKRITKEELSAIQAKQSEIIVKQEVPQSNADEIKKFKELLDLGAITEEEFNAKKKELLGL